MSKGNIILLVVIGILLFAIAFGIGILVFAGGQSATDVVGEDGLPKYDLEKSVLYAIGGEPILSNLNTGSVKDKRVIRVKAQLRVADGKFADKLEASDVIIHDTIMSILRKKTPEEVIKPEAKELIKQEIIRELNACFETDKILDVYFQEFIVQ
ncbi:MAG: flagellar basal body-associated FliL family protein [Firmicutes bacterium]|nr:flagellar basal body-associated FliL family protein [Bacillota bacterium]